MNDAPDIQELRKKAVQKYIKQMPSLSTTVTKVLEICNDPLSSPNDLNRVISLDPVLTGNVLSLINSAYYAQRTQVTSLTRAIIMLGINTIKNLVLSTAIVATMGGKKTFRTLSMDDFWTHSICVGVTARAVAGIKQVPKAQREEYFLAGLLHDLGKIPLSNQFPADYAKVMEIAKVKNIPIYRAEQVLMKLDHSVTGDMIADKWGLSGGAREAIACHHTPENASDENRDMIYIVAVANAYANGMIFEQTDEPPAMAPLPPGLLSPVGIEEQTFFELRDTVLAEIGQAKKFLKIK